MKRVVLKLMVFMIFLFTMQAVQASASLSGVQIYPKDYIWNVPIDIRPVHPMSDTYIGSSSPSAFMYVAPVFPINVVDSTQAKQKLTYIQYPEMSDNIAYPIPDNPEIENVPDYPDQDHHLLIYNKDTNTEYELYQPVKAGDGTWSAFVAMKFNLSDYSLRTDGYPSADAAGLAILPALIRYEEVEAGEINHAMRVAMPTSGNKHVWPARADGVQNSASFPPLGQRFRLKASFNTAGYSPHAKTILEAWKKYGFMLSDQTGEANAWVIAADSDPRWLTLGGDKWALFNEMMTVHGSDFEAVDVSSLMINKDSGQARITPSTTPTPTPTKTPTPTPTPTSSITVTSPNGGETWKRGTSHIVTWNYSGSPGSYVKIVLIKGVNEIGTIASSVPIGSGGKGSYTWSTSLSATTGSNYKVSIQSISHPTIKDMSNGYFTITSRWW